MRSIVLLFALVVYLLPVPGQILVPPKKYHSEDDDAPTVPEENEDELDTNSTSDKGMYLGAFCEDTCSPKLSHVYCNPTTKLCECDKKYPVRLNPATGCGKPKKLGEQCYYKETCTFADQYSSCIQIHHNAICQCKTGYHTVSIQKPSKREFCAEDLAVMTTNFSTFAGVLSGIALLSGLICFVLKLFNQNLYTGRHRYGNANLPPPILFSSDAGLLPMMDRQLTSSVSSQRTFESIQSRRASSAQGISRGIPVSASRAGAARAAAILLLSCHDTSTKPAVPQTPKSLHSTGSRRPSIASVHSGTSVRSYSMRRYEKEREQKEEREMQKRLSRMTSLANSSSRIPPTPSPHSTDDLLPTLEEDKQVNIFPNEVPLAISEESSNSFQDEIPSTSKQYP